MLHLIVTGRSLAPGHWRTTMLSIAAHAGFVVAVMTPRNAVPVREPRVSAGLTPIERVRFIVAAPAPAPEHRTIAKSRSAKPRSAATKHSAIAPASPVGKLASLSLRIPTVDLDSAPRIADVDLTTKVSDSSDFVAPRTLAEVIGAALVNRRTSATTGAYGAYTADVVDRVVTALSDNPRPVYPRSLESQGIEADFTVMFVVDSTGRVDGSTLEVPKSVHRLFADAVRYTLSRSRYLPATLGGRPVRQLVAQEFVFRMRR